MFNPAWYNNYMWSLIAAFAVLLATLIATLFMLNALYSVFRLRIPYVPTAAWAVKWLHDKYPLPPGATVYDMGCGDGRVLAELAVKNPDAKFIGIEVQWWPYVLAKWRARKIINLTIERVDFWSRDIHDATHVFCYLFQPILVKMKNKFETELRPNTMVISFGFRIPDWTTKNEIADPNGKTHSRLLFYRR